MSDARRLQAFLRTAAAVTRTQVAAPPFVVHLNGTDPSPYRNYAVPADGADPDLAQVEALRAVFQAHDRLPRVEFVEEAAPALPAALERAGMVLELRGPLMACAAADVREPPVDVAGLRVASIGDGDVHDLIAVQRAAFDEPPLAPGVEPTDPRSVNAGAVLARVGAEAVAAAGRSPVVDGTSEIWGVATVEGWRRRGLGGLVTAAAARDAAAAGATLLVLSPGDEGAQRVYARAGFVRVATTSYWRDIGDPPATA